VSPEPFIIGAPESRALCSARSLGAPLGRFFQRKYRQRCERAGTVITRLPIIGLLRVNARRLFRRTGTSERPRNLRSARPAKRRARPIATADRDCASAANVSPPCVRRRAAARGASAARALGEIPRLKMETNGRAGPDNVVALKRDLRGIRTN